jgi:hypothetical protein
VTTLDTPDFSPAVTSAAPDGVGFVQVAVTVPPASTVTVEGAVFGPISYSIGVDGEISAAATVPFMRVGFIWKDPTNTWITDLQHWVVPVSDVSPASSNTYTTGRGPSGGGHLTVNLKNYDPAYAITADIYVMQSSRFVSRHDWRSASNNTTFATPGGLTNINGNYLWTTPDSDPSNLVLGEMAKVAIANGAYQGRINALFTGQGYLVVSKDDNANTLLVTVAAINPDVVPGGGQHVFGFQTQLTGYQTTGYITMPRGPIVVLLQNQGPGNIGNVLYSLTGQEFAS